jgi:glycosyltransferase involved in cell wall biosynthesis
VTPNLVVAGANIDDGHPGLQEARERGWEVDLLPAPAVGSLRSRVREHLRQDMPISASVAARVTELSRESAFVQLEGPNTLSYGSSVVGGTPVVASTYHVDSALRHELLTTEGRLGLRERYRLHRMMRSERRVVRRADAIFCVSDADRRHFLEIGAPRVLLVANGVDDDLFEVPAITEPARQVLFFGEFAFAPNLDGIRRFIEGGWKGVRAAVPEARLRIAGPHSRERLADVAGQADGIDVLGLVPDLRSELRDARLVIAPLWSGAGTRIKVLEALAAARPVVGTPFAVQGLGFQPERHGLLAETPEGLAQAAVRILRDGRAARSWGEAARSFAEEYRWTKVTAPAEAIYRSFAASATAR